MKENSALNKPVGIWIRVSTEDQAKGESPEHHEERARSYAKSRGGWSRKCMIWLAKAARQSCNTRKPGA
jgi:site-specific DNA recombinase